MFNNKLTGYRRKEERLTRESWEQIRALGFLFLQPHLKKGSKATPQKFWKFPWDGEGQKQKKENPGDALKKSRAMWDKIDQKRASAKKEKE